MRKEKPETQTARRGKQYPGAHGKVVDWVEHKFEEGILFIDIRFVDKTALSWSIGAAIVIKETHLGDWKTGDFKLLKRFVREQKRPRVMLAHPGP